MAQITIRLDDKMFAAVKDAAKRAGVSQNQWIADAIGRRIKAEWSASVAALAGCWPDFPSAEEIRANAGTDVYKDRM